MNDGVRLEMEPITKCPICYYWSSDQQYRKEDRGAKILYKRCASCGIWYASSMMSDESAKAFYNGSYRAFAMGNNLIPQSEIDNEVSRAQYQSKLLMDNVWEHVLDVGSGLGKIGRLLLSSGHANEVIGVEPDPTYRSYSDVRAVETIEDLPAHLKFDLVIASHVLEHITKPNKFINSLQYLMVDNAHLLIEVPNADTVHSSNI